MNDQSRPSYAELGLDPRYDISDRQRADFYAAAYRELMDLCGELTHSVQPMTNEARFEAAVKAIGAYVVANHQDWHSEQD